MTCRVFRFEPMAKAGQCPVWMAETVDIPFGEYSGIVILDMEVAPHVAFGSRKAGVVTRYLAMGGAEKVSTTE